MSQTFCLSIDDKLIELPYQAILTNATLDNPNDGNQLVAEVNHNPNDPQILGLCNLSPQEWYVTFADGKSKQIRPGGSVKLEKNMVINFGDIAGTIHTLDPKPVEPSPSPAPTPAPTKKVSPKSGLKGNFDASEQVISNVVTKRKEPQHSKKKLANLNSIRIFSVAFLALFLISVLGITTVNNYRKKATFSQIIDGKSTLKEALSFKETDMMTLTTEIWDKFYKNKVNHKTNCYYKVENTFYFLCLEQVEAEKIAVNRIRSRLNNIKEEEETKILQSRNLFLTGFLKKNDYVVDYLEEQIKNTTTLDEHKQMNEQLKAMITEEELQSDFNYYEANRFKFTTDKLETNSSTKSSSYNSKPDWCYDVDPNDIRIIEANGIKTAYFEKCNVPR